MKLLTLVFLLFAFSSLALTEVVGSFQRCPDFFFRNPGKKAQFIFPTVFTGPQYKMICQRWKNKFRFATVYDTQNRIPVYSAYTFLKTDLTKFHPVWKIEPQLDGITKDITEKPIKDRKEMMDSPDIAMAKAMKITHQAVDLDYGRSLYTRGHVFPRSFAADQDQAESTYTLTNIAPQTSDSNEKWAKQVEELMKTLIQQKCRLDNNHQAYIVTGVVPGNRWIAIERDKDIENGINVPSYYWTAFCCTSNNNPNKLIGTGCIATMENFTPQQASIDDLNTRLSTLYGSAQNFSVFPGLTVENIKSLEIRFCNVPEV